MNVRSITSRFSEQPYRPQIERVNPSWKRISLNFLGQLSHPPSKMITNRHGEESLLDYRLYEIEGNIYLVSVLTTFDNMGVERVVSKHSLEVTGRDLDITNPERRAEAIKIIAGCFAPYDQDAIEKIRRA